MFLYMTISGLFFPKATTVASGEGNFQPGSLVGEGDCLIPSPLGDKHHDHLGLPVTLRKTKSNSRKHFELWGYPTALRIS